MMSTPSVDQLRGDIRFAFRQLGRNPVLTLIAVATLALGIGATSALFSVVYSVPLRPLPYAHPERLIRLRERNGANDTDGMAVTSGNYWTWAGASHAFEVFGASQNGQDLTITRRQKKFLSRPFLQANQLKDSLHAYQLSKRGNSLRVMAEAVRWGKRGARVNTISPGIIINPLAKDELNGPRGPGYRRMIEGSAVGRVGTPDEVGAVAALLMGADGGFITGSDFLMDGGVTPGYWYGDLAEVRA